MTWSSAIPIDADSATILAHIIPTRTKALGQMSAGSGTTVIDSDEVNMLDAFGFSDSNQGHSAQFYDSYLNREGYWKQVLKEFKLGNL